MDCEKIGSLIRTLRLEKNMTQKNLADELNLSDKAISKWERGLGLPDVSLLPSLSDVLGVNIREMLNGDLMENETVGGNMKNLKYYICPICGNVTVSTGNITIACCGRNVEIVEPKKAKENEMMTVEIIEDDWFITSSHPMAKDNYISFTAFVMSEKIEVIKHYPEWNLQLRIPRYGHGKLIWYSRKEGLLYQLI